MAHIDSALGLAALTILTTPAWSLASDMTVAAEKLKLVAADTGSTDQFGASIAMHGDTLVASAGGAKAAYVFVDNGFGWVEDAKLTADGVATGFSFGWPVSLSGDTLALGGLTEDGAALFLYERENGEWVRDETMSLSAPGSAFIPGAFSVSSGTLMTTSKFPLGVRVFVRNGDQWNPAEDLVFSEDITDASLRVLVKGDIALVAAITWGPGIGGTSGKVFVFENEGESWVETAILRSGEAYDGFGDNDMDVDGDTIVVSADDYDVQGTLTNAGAAYLFERTAQGWRPLQRLESPAPGIAYRFGNSVGLSGDRVLIGEPGSDEWGDFVGCTPLLCEMGAAHLFVREGATFVHSDMLVASDPLVGDSIGSDVALGETRAVVSSGSIDFAGASNSGGAYIYELVAPFFSETTEVSLATGGMQSFDLAAGSTQPGQLFLILGSATGTSPGIPWGDVTLPLNYDPYFLYTLSHVLSPNWFYAYGNLSTQGTANSLLFVPSGLDPALAGLTLHHAFVALDPESLSPTFASNAVPTTFVP